MNRKLCFLILVLTSAAYATEWGPQMPWDMKIGYTDWQRCRYRGIDLIGVAKLVSFDPAKSNEEGIEATFRFTDMMKGAPGEYVVTIPDSMRAPMNMTFDLEEWNRTKQLGPWQWKVGETYGFLCISNVYSGIRMVDWVVPLDKWGEFKASAEKERAEFEAFVKEKKLECLELGRKIDGIREREDLGEEEKEVRRGLLSERQTEINFQVQEKGEPYFLPPIDWSNLDETWPIEVDEREQRKRILGL